MGQEYITNSIFIWIKLNLLDILWMRRAVLNDKHNIFYYYVRVVKTCLTTLSGKSERKMMLREINITKLYT